MKIQLLCLIPLDMNILTKSLNMFKLLKRTKIPFINQKESHVKCSNENELY